ncbi:MULTISPECIES: cytochrome d ubiquinol oxidase subunit II [Halomonadaceae]|uniref:cytochrome d ubiquinol oxidase subunit II n=1 Tax=Halomonadaceae TaxID=28256 RepID=UPI0012EF70AA|nr:MULTISPECIES: cytochrome d ubiquinol oxidase subunit II [Halomonas]CAD5260794.1 Ubiquinol oxidase subunit II [Halomonas sp. 59]CAD5261082.1 Ubiquinol oxidase subunit II [Halomonas sp. 113]CAD5275014.1 Ubiquinol oxidase subunit II [Halomonas sp. I3]CAD5287610.1 Ubiquinol oxidase subunit II [Halomonas sp. 156]VXB42215.1 Ubiquinol oxidase subunit II [Halomonas titanicae]
MGIDLSLTWAIIILFGLMMYVVMDGFDLGIGLLFLRVHDEQERDIMTNTVAPVWDGNETWLVLGGAGLFAAFPLAYAVVLEALAIPLIVMLLGLIFRGVAFEFRFKASPERRHVWDKAFIGGSLLATVAQGVALGGYIQGIAFDGVRFSGGSLDWLTPFSLLCGVGLLFAYALLGSTWLIMKTEGALQQRMYRITKPLMLGLLVMIALVSVWTPLAYPNIAARWFSLPNLLWFLPVPLLVMLVGWWLWRAIAFQDTALPFVLVLALVFLGYSGLGISLWPTIIPPDASIWQVAAPAQSQGFALVGTLFILPIILMYTAWSYYVFRGKVKPGDAYH